MISEQVLEGSPDRRGESPGGAEQVFLTVAQQRVRAVCGRVRLELLVGADLPAGRASRVRIHVASVKTNWRREVHYERDDLARFDEEFADVC